MLLASALFALFLGGFWLYCLTDAILTPGSECRGMPKPAWIALIAVTFIGGAVAWLIARQPVHAPLSARVPSSPFLVEELDEQQYQDPDSYRWTDADDAVARHPAGRARETSPAGLPKGPDDDPAFLQALARAIRNSYERDEEL
jgi:hypothetical protein